MKIKPKQGITDSFYLAIVLTVLCFGVFYKVLGLALSGVLAVRQTTFPG